MLTLIEKAFEVDEPKRHFMAVSFLPVLICYPASRCGSTKYYIVCTQLHKISAPSYVQGLLGPITEVLTVGRFHKSEGTRPFPRRTVILIVVSFPHFIMVPFVSLPDTTESKTTHSG